MPRTSATTTISTAALRGLRWGISSLGCGELTLPEVCALCARFDLSEVELRSLAGRLDLPAYLDEMYPAPAEARKLLQQSGLHVVSLNSSFKLIGSGSADRKALIEFVPWAEVLGVPFIRVFGGGSMDAPLSEEDMGEACRQFEWWFEEKAENDWQVDLILETHDGFSSSDRCLELDARLPGDLPVIWDTHHTWKLGGEDPRHTWERMGQLVRHVHIKDSISAPSARHPYSYVLPGEGEFPALETLQVLAEGGYNGVVCLEWERKWHPYLPPIDEALAALTTAGWRA